MSRNLFKPRILPSNINKLIPTLYLLMDALLKNMSFICIYPINILLYSEKGVIKQLKLFKNLSNKLIACKINKSSVNLTTNKNKNIYLLFLFLKKEFNRSNNIYIYILIGYTKHEIYKKKFYNYLNNIKFKNEPDLNLKELLEWKDKHLNSNKRKEFKKQFDKDYKDNISFIKENLNNPKLIKFIKLNENKFKIYKFDKELKAIQKSIFYTCKVKDTLEELFPNF